MRHVRVVFNFDTDMTDEAIDRILTDAWVQIEEPADDVEGATASLHASWYVVEEDGSTGRLHETGVLNLDFAGVTNPDAPKPTGLDREIEKKGYDA